ncbi:MAG: glutaredoxin family protein [Myxococcales bacterium]
MAACPRIPANPRLRAGSALLLCLAACHHGAPASALADAGEGPSEALPVVRVVPDGGPYVFSWYDPAGKVQDADSLAKVPAAARKQLLVRDLSRTASELRSDRYLYLADLSGAPPGDGWPTSVVSRYTFEAQDDQNLPALGGEGETGDGGTGAGPLVTIYGTSWCGACRAAREHFKQRHVPFADKDIEKDPAAARELERKAKRAGLRLGGVPVLEVGGKLMMGFDADAVDRLLGAAER